MDCFSGSPQQFAWWETYPANSIQEYGDPVSAGDSLTSTVTDTGGTVIASTGPDDGNGDFTVTYGG